MPTARVRWCLVALRARIHDAEHAKAAISVLALGSKSDACTVCGRPHRYGMDLVRGHLLGVCAGCQTLPAPGGATSRELSCPTALEVLWGAWRVHHVGTWTSVVAGQWVHGLAPTPPEPG